MSTYHSIYCIIPPHMLREVAERGTPAQRQWARANIAQAGRARGQREATLAETLAKRTATAQTTINRSVYTANNTTNLPGTLVRDEGDPASGDMAVDEAYEGSGATYSLFKDIYQRNSIDGRGLSLLSTVHYDNSFDNAFWNGEQMVYGDGDEDLPPDERIFNRFTSAIDIIGHELAHGVTQHEANLTYALQSGALNESMSDVFGILVKQRTLNHAADQSDWIIGAGIFTSNVNADGIRNMQAPGTAYDDPLLGKDPQPAHMDDYQIYPYDNGGVHINSGIPNRAFYRTAIEIGGFAWEKAGRIWYITLRDKLNLDSGFQEAADQTYAVAGELYGQNSLEQQAVVIGWQDVGITIGGSATTTGGCLPIEQLLRFLPGSQKGT